MITDPTAILGRFGQHVEAELRDIVGNSTLPFYEMMRYHLGWIETDGSRVRASGGGKMLRPALCLLSVEACGGEITKAMPAAAALELVHNFSLIHDDIQDRSRERRHRPTVWTIWGEPQAINTGDGMHVLARLAALRLGRSFSPEIVLKVVEVLDEACLRLCEGQFRDISFETRIQVAADEYITMIEGKTAALLSGACKIGALLGSDDPAVIEAFSVFGEKLGLAFQVKDDYLGIWGKQEQTGKSTDGDIDQRKKTLPVVYALEHGSSKNRETLAQLYSRQELTNGDKEAIVGLIEESGAKSYTERYASRLLTEGITELESTSLSHPSVGALISLARFVVERDY